ncbi:MULTISPECIES: hypothetical protein [unclassified Saccharopolyspora]|uniref:hypothetical protein n=1 Tax=unclassified Saccharopolyspora TaxID=2646250 RepID=UPI001CD791BE|nr:MULTISPECIES: hypothetical protein [unclassified Saccharopolyspora]MCA1186908.1 hypothetical protein [Saccharopolyspora sp. 6T]MCA1193329.1 hypothetical protein [Saccharopolyspora sp. 6V]MCA1228038.1 hypothetical protein [Saccharopolyspora sp. 6M]MCA1281392.1 hypothetical protein [Saccharopolyspora sp. 7B]
MFRPGRALPALAAAGLLAATACGDVDVPPRERDGLLLRIRTEPPGPGSTSVPDYSLYGDGTVITPGEPVGSLRPFAVTRLRDTEVDQRYRAAHEAGLAADETHGDAAVPGATSIRVDLRSGGEEHRTELVFTDRPAGPPELVDFVQRLRTAPPAGAEPAADRMAVIAHDADSAPGGRPWPFPSPVAGSRVPGGRCTVLTGGDAATAATWARETDPGTRWGSGGVGFRLVFRPLLPDETGCADLDPR